MTDFRYKAFISYSWKDREAAERLHRKLEAFQTPKQLLRDHPEAPARLIPIFKDREEEAAGASLKTAIETALEQSEFLIVVCSPNSAKSPWVNKEIAFFRARRDPHKILTYIIDGEPTVSLHPGKPGEECFPPALMWATREDGETLDMALEPPLSADARGEGDGERNARLKIAAAMLGVGLDDLVRREDQRRARRQRTIAAGATALSVLMTALAGAALVAREQAVENERRAEREAMKATRTAEFMIDLFEVVDPSEARGREVTAKEILDKGVASIETALAAEPDVQASLMHTMGRVYTGLGLYKEASGILESAIEKRKATAADPADLYATKVAHARALLETGDLDAAGAAFTPLVEEAEAAIARGDWRDDYASALIGMGETTLYADDPAKAETYYRRARELLAARGMKGTELDAVAAQGLAGAIDFQGGRFEEAEATYQEAILEFAALFGASSIPVAYAKNDLGNAYYFNGDIDPALEQLIQSLDILNTLLSRDHPQTLSISNNVARLLYETGDLTEAETLLTETIQIWRSLGKPEYFEAVFLLNTLGEIYNDTNRHTQASAIFDEASSLIEGDRHRLYGPIKLGAARSACLQDRYSDGLATFRDGRAALSKFYEPSDWRYALADEVEAICHNHASSPNVAAELAIKASKDFEIALGAEHHFTRRAKSFAEGLSK